MIKSNQQNQVKVFFLVNHPVGGIKNMLFVSPVEE